MPEYLGHTPDEFAIHEQGGVHVAMHKQTEIGAQGRTPKAAIEAAARAVERRLPPVDVSDDWKAWTPNNTG